METDKCISLEDFEARLRNRSRIKKVWLVVKYRVRAIMDFPYHVRRIGWFIQRGKRGYADCDWWNMDGYLASIIVPMLKKMRVDSCGYPGHGKASTPEKWNGLLDEMVECFEAAQRVIEDEYYTIVPPDFPEKKATSEEVNQWMEMNKADQKLFKEKAKIFTDWFFNLWD